MPNFDGKTYDPQYDQKRLEKQLGRVFEVMISGRWHTLEEIEVEPGDRQAGISARIRDLRKPQFGGYTVNRRARGDRHRGLFEYQLLKPDNKGQMKLFK